VQPYTPPPLTPLPTPPSHTHTTGLVLLCDIPPSTPPPPLCKASAMVGLEFMVGLAILPLLWGMVRKGGPRLAPIPRADRPPHGRRWGRHGGPLGMGWMGRIDAPYQRGRRRGTMPCILSYDPLAPQGVHDAYREPQWLPNMNAVGEPSRRSRGGTPRWRCITNMSVLQVQAQVKEVLEFICTHILARACLTVGNGNDGLPLSNALCQYLVTNPGVNGEAAACMPGKEGKGERGVLELLRMVTILSVWAIIKRIILLYGSMHTELCALLSMGPLLMGMNLGTCVDVPIA